MFTTKTLKTTLEKVFFVFILCFMKHKSVKVFDVHIMWLIFINHKQQIQWVFKLLIWNIDWKNSPIFITKCINANVFFFNLANIFFSHRKLNFIIMQIISKFFVILSNSFWMYFYWINMPNIAHFWSLFLMLISPFSNFLIQQVGLCKNVLIIAYKLKS